MDQVKQAIPAVISHNGKVDILVNNAGVQRRAPAVDFAEADAAAKGGVGQLTKALANEWAKFGVNVNAIVPGYLLADMNEALLANEERNKQITERIPAGRWGSPEDNGEYVFYTLNRSPLGPQLSDYERAGRCVDLLALFNSRVRANSSAQLIVSG